MFRSISITILALLAPGAAWAESMAWRAATVIATQAGSETVRRGVAIFADGEPATLTLRLRPTAAPSQGRMPFSTHSVYRFDDGSTFTIEGAGTAAMSPEGVPLPVENLIEGSFVGGTGRFAGIAGTVTLRSRSGFDRTAPGVLGEQFSTGEGTYTLAR